MHRKRGEWNESELRQKLTAKKSQTMIENEIFFHLKSAQVSCSLFKLNAIEIQFV